ncbi:Cytochrome P450 736A117-like protein [Drosera capensis]
MEMKSIQQWLEPPAMLNTILYHPVPCLAIYVFMFILYKIRQSATAATAGTPYGKLPPSPLKVPIIGHLHLLSKYPHHSLQSLSSGEIMLLYLGSKPTVIVSSANAACQVMKIHDSVYSSRPASRFRTFNYEGKDVANAPYGEYWRHVKTICTLHLLSAKRVRSLQRVRVEETTLLIEKIKTMMTAREGAEPTIFNLTEMVNCMTNDVTCRMAFGRKYGREGDGQGGRDSGNWYELLREYTGLVGSAYIGDYVPALGWINHVNGVNRRTAKIMSELDKLMEEIIDDHLDSDRLNDEEEDNNTKMKDLVDVLLKIQKESTLVDRESIKAILLDMFTAGTDATLTALEWAIAELLKNPSAMQELQKEITEMTRDSDSTLITEDDTEKMKYLKAVIKETLRLHPPGALLVPRESIQDAVINGRFIPANTQVIINAWAIQRDPANWERPEEFRPQRFLNSTIDYKGHDFRFIPFGAGRRSCPGMTFAVVTIKLVLANLIGKFDWSLPNSTALDMTESPGTVASKKLPLIVSAARR